MSRIATIKTLVTSLPRGKQIDHNGRPAFKLGLAKGKKLGFAVHTDGRCYVPEALRGRGVGYNGRRVTGRSDRQA
jgi:hypothetical protein